MLSSLSESFNLNSRNTTFNFLLWVHSALVIQESQWVHASCSIICTSVWLTNEGATLTFQGHFHFTNVNLLTWGNWQLVDNIIFLKSMLFLDSKITLIKNKTSLMFYYFSFLFIHILKFLTLIFNTIIILQKSNFWNIYRSWVQAHQ